MRSHSGVSLSLGSSGFPWKALNDILSNEVAHHILRALARKVSLWSRFADVISDSSRQRIISVQKNKFPDLKPKQSSPLFSIHLLYPTS